MEHQKILNLLNEANDSKFVTRKWTNVNVNNFKPFEYKPKLLENTKAQPSPNNLNRILKNSTIAVPLKYLSNYWR